MMRCEDVQEQVAHLAAGEVDSTLRLELEAHLRHCMACSDQATDLRRALQALEDEDAPDPGEAYWAAFDSRLRQRIAGSRRRSRLQRFLALAAAAVLVAGLALVVVRRDRGARQQTAQNRRDNAEAFFEDLLQRAASGQGGLRGAQAILDEMVPVDELEIEDALGSLSPQEREELARDLSGTEG